MFKEISKYVEENIIPKDIKKVKVVDLKTKSYSYWRAHPDEQPEVEYIAITAICDKQPLYITIFRNATEFESSNETVYVTGKQPDLYKLPEYIEDEVVTSTQGKIKAAFDTVLNGDSMFIPKHLQKIDALRFVTIHQKIDMQDPHEAIKSIKKKLKRLEESNAPEIKEEPKGSLNGYLVFSNYRSGDHVNGFCKTIDDVMDIIYITMEDNNPDSTEYEEKEVRIRQQIENLKGTQGMCYFEFKNDNYIYVNMTNIPL